MIEQDQIITTESGKLKTSDGVELYWQGWQANVAKGVIIIIHGLADHGMRFAETGQFFADHGWTVYACDLRGHGQSSDGHQSGRVHIDNFQDYGKDVHAILALSKQRHPDLAHVILGHSMGGLVALSYVLEHPQELDGMVLSSPALGAHPDVKPPLIVHWLARAMAHLWPRLLFPSGVDSSSVSRDPQVVRDYENDPLVSSKVSAKFYVEISDAIKDIQGRASELKIPTLLMQSGDDRLIDPEVVTHWAGRAPAQLLKLIVWDDLYHEMFNEPEKDQVRACVLEWLSDLFGHFPE